MSSGKEVLSYDRLVDSTHTKLAGLGPYQQADCTGEFNVISTELFGGNIFGENAVVKCGNSSNGPAIYFYDRVLEGRANHGSYPLQAAALNKDGFHVAENAVLVDWLSARQIREDGTFAYAGERAAVANSPFSLSGFDKSALDALTPKLATARIAARTGLIIPTERQVTARKTAIARIASALGDLSDVADIAEAIGTENRVVPHVLRSSDGGRAIEALSNEHNRNLECREDGIWVAVAPGRLTIRSETFVARATYRDKAIDTAEEKFWGLSGARVLMAVGRDFDSGERKGIATGGQITDTANRQFMGQTYGTPYEIEPSSLPHGTLAKGNSFGVNYRVFVAK